MEFSKIISKNFLCSGAPTQVATVGIEALDVSTGTLYIQNRIPSGTSWVVKSKNYYQTTDISWDAITGKPTYFPFKITEVEIDFGSFPVSSKRLTISDETVTPSSMIVVTPSGNVATGRVGDDWEWDSIVFSAKPNAGSFTLTANASGRIRGKRKILYTWQ